MNTIEIRTRAREEFVDLTAEVGADRGRFGGHERASAS